MYQLLPDLGIPHVAALAVAAAVIARTRHACDGRRTIVYIYILACVSCCCFARLMSKILKS